MKKLYIIIFALISLNTFAQKDYAQYYNAWRLGLNIGGAWQTADYRSCWGMAGGLTLEKGFAENNTNFFSFAIRGRYLAANTYGMDYNRNYNIRNNGAYNGAYDPKVNFVDSVSFGRQFVYDNYKTTLYEGALELQISFNRLRAQTHVILNLWGGIGITSYRAKSDLLDGNGRMYDFSKIDSSGNRSMTLNSYNGLIDKKYESYALGSRSGNLITFSPSAGIGLGYQFSPVFSLLLEYKVTFPQGTNADFLDGKVGANNDVIAGSNDYYHYTGINFLFTLRGKKKTTTPNEETVYTNTVTPVNPVVPTTSITPTEPIVTPTVITTEPKPVITFITPPVNGHTVINPQYKISAQVLNVSNAGQIQFRLNNANYSNFTFNPQTHILEFNANLNVGNNPVQIIATNNSGSDSKASSVIYQLQRALGNPPNITVVNPSSCPANSTVGNYVLVANTMYVASKNDVSVKVNGAFTSVFSFNVNTGKINLPLNLIDGNNSVEITVNNSYGNNSKTCFINYMPPKQVEVLPVVSFIDPAQPGMVSPTQAYTVKAQVLNVAGQNNITVYYNGVAAPFTYDGASQQISFPANLNVGTNTITVTANNSSGSDTKTSNVIYKTTRGTINTGLPPGVTLITPATAQNASSNSSYNFKLGVLNVASKNDVTVLFNGSPTSTFFYNATAKEITLNSTLIQGNNTLVVKAINNYGVDSKTIQVVYQPAEVVKTPPVVTFIKPSPSPASIAIPNYTFKATVSNVPGNTGLVVKLNGTVISGFVYDGFNLSANAILMEGTNIFEVTATNTDGTDTKNAIVIYKPKVITRPVPPVVSLINPVSQLNATDNIAYNFKLSVLNVASQADITLTFNGSNVTNFTYNATTKEVFFQTNLSVGNNVLIVKGTNQFGSDSKQVDVSFTPHAEIKTPPVVAFVNPVATDNVQNPNYNFTATISNILSASDLVVTYNGVVITNYTFSGVNFAFSAALNLGVNTLQITATNQDGSDVKSVTVNYAQKIVLPRPPSVVILKPTTNPTVNALSYNFQFKVLNATQNQTEVYLNGTAVTSYNFANGLGDFTANLTEGLNTLLVKATTAGGTASKSETVKYVIKKVVLTENPDSINIVGVKEEAFADSNKLVTICHIDGKITQTMVVKLKDVAAHKAHGDTEGDCGGTGKEQQDGEIKPRRINTGETTPEQNDTLKATPISPPVRPR